MLRVLLLFAHLSCACFYAGRPRLVQFSSTTESSDNGDSFAALILTLANCLICRFHDDMPYRTELKRPDLKGTFACGVCQKVFCHSSSLSRHRMQAHFKNYTCAVCHKQINSNEVLRAHMYKQHQITRTFMCRCCNWAFPDKASLEMHVQSMNKQEENGSQTTNTTTTGAAAGPSMSLSSSAVSSNSVATAAALLAANPFLSSAAQHLQLLQQQNQRFPSPSLLNWMTQMSKFSVNQPEQPLSVNCDNRDTAPNVGALSSLTEPAREELKSSTAAGAERLGSEANSPSMDRLCVDEDEEHEEEEEEEANCSSSNNGPLGSSPTLLDSDSGTSATEPNSTSLTVADVSTASPNSEMPLLRSAISNNGSMCAAKTLNNLLFRKMVSALIANEAVRCQTAAKQQQQVVKDETNHPPPQQEDWSSPAEPSTAAGACCLQCQIGRDKIVVANHRNGLLEEKLDILQSEVERLERKLTQTERRVAEQENDGLQSRNQSESLQRKLLHCQEMTLLFMQRLSGDTELANCSADNLQQFLAELLRATLAQAQAQSC